MVSVRTERPAQGVSEAQAKPDLLPDTNSKGLQFYLQKLKRACGETCRATWRAGCSSSCTQENGRSETAQWHQPGKLLWTPAQTGEVLGLLFLSCQFSFPAPCLCLLFHFLLIFTEGTKKPCCNHLTFALIVVRPFVFFLSFFFTCHNSAS